MSPAVSAATFPRRVRRVEHCWIPVRDRSRLAARIWLPEDAEAAPVPAILEYIPYRKHDGTSVRDSVRQPYVAGQSGDYRLIATESADTVLFVHRIPH